MRVHLSNVSCPKQTYFQGYPSLAVDLGYHLAMKIFQNANVQHLSHQPECNTPPYGGTRVIEAR
jgi:hypothetical protein